MRQAIFIALGLALGTGLVITVTSAATGVNNAQAAVLYSLYGVGTDLTITQPPRPGARSGDIVRRRADRQARGAAVRDRRVRSPPTTASGVAAKLTQQVGNSATHTVYVTLTAPVTLNAIGLAAARASRTALMRDRQLTLSPAGRTPTSPDV